MRNAIPHPRIMGVIKECGGKMWMQESKLPTLYISYLCLTWPVEAWGKASEDLFESFRQYDESGSAQRIQVLKYLVLNTMLMGSDINPFDSQETKPCVSFLKTGCSALTSILADTKTTLKSWLWRTLFQLIKGEMCKRRREYWKVSLSGYGVGLQ